MVREANTYVHTYHVVTCLNMHDQHTFSFALGTLELMQNLNADLKDHSVCLRVLCPSCSAHWYIHAPHM